MSLSYALEHVSASTESVLVELAAKSEYVLTYGPGPNPDNKNETIAVYTLNSGDLTYPATVTYGCETTLKGGKPIRRVRMTFTTWATETDSVTGVIRREPISTSWAMNIPVTFSVELADLDDFLGVGFSHLFASQSSGARTTTYLSRLQLGSPAVV